MIFINKIKNHSKIKTKLLKYIKNIPNNSLKDSGSVSHTDWNLASSYKEEYANLFLSMIQDELNNLMEQFKAKQFIIGNIWFQQYVKKDYHDWHCHSNAHFANVYFLELPSGSLGTEILNHKKLKLKEGDLLTFPAYYFHRSPINLTNKRKTVIAFNSSIDEFNGKID